ncbi:MAG: DUF72 domain-containing protein [Desulfobacterales bacterium]|nr:MAG: DUF72 domain-containing protein [Desulfobacterales bacterium]
MQRIYIGTSGWNYKHWKGVFYAQGCPQSKWLEFYTAHFASVEVNATFYRQMQPRTFETWRQRTPAGFRWSVKANKYITHIKRLEDFQEPLQKFLDSLAPLKEKLGSVLFQLPPTLAFDEEVIRTFCEGLEAGRRYTIEARHPSWLADNAQQALKRHQIAWCISDTGGRYPYLEAVTAGFIYIRLHGPRKLYASEYSEAELQTWAEKIQKWDKETYVYFDNDFKGYAPQNALRLAQLLATS